MEIEIPPMSISDENYTINAMVRPSTKSKQMGTQNVYKHLTDHDYLHSKPKRLHRNQKKYVKITELKAIYNCTVCGYRTMDRNVLHKHICTNKLKQILHKNTIKKLPRGYKTCSKCNISTEKSIVHMQSNSVQRKCTSCTITKINSGTYTYQCSKCNYSTHNPTSLKIHMHVHSRGTPYKCTECDFSGTDLKHLIRHYDVVKDLRCECGYATHVKKQMIVHMRSHTGEKPYSCGICNFSTSDRAGLHRHMKKKHIVE